MVSSSRTHSRQAHSAVSPPPLVIPTIRVTCVPLRGHRKQQTS
ncbi:hypothetical protein [Streptomyces chartreusis]